MASPAIAPLVSGILFVLSGDKNALKDLQQAALMAPDSVHVRAALGGGALASGDEAQAREVLVAVPAAALYYAMAQSEGAGGLSRAQSTLAEHAKLPDGLVSPGALFLTALAFANAGQSDRADEVLARAVKLAPSALDEAFAPDPAVGAVRFAVAAIEELGGDSDALAQIAGALAASGRPRDAL